MNYKFMKDINCFEDFLKNIKIIQFDYGGTNIDNNLKLNGFYKFAYLTKNGTELITDFNDHYKYCNIVCINKNSDIIQLISLF